MTSPERLRSGHTHANRGQASDLLEVGRRQGVDDLVDDYVSWSAERRRGRRMSAQPTSARHSLIHHRTHDRVPETKAPWRLRRTDQIRANKLIEHAQRQRRGAVGDRRDQLGLKRLTRDSGGV